jgi:formylglycine-generating enzyme required for sulfatase activity
LPTEAEWEKAARGGLKDRIYPWGNEPPGDQCNWLGYDGCYQQLRPDFYHGRGVLPVGTFPPNGFGLFDMAGNVWEWCEDSYHRDGYGQQDLRINPLETKPSSLRILRGGSWSFDPVNLRIANRSYAEPQKREGYDGFRCALSGREVSS